MVFQYFGENLTHQVVSLSLYSARRSLKLERADLQIHLLWCKTGICSWNPSVEVSLMLDNPFPVLFLCNFFSLYVMSLTVCLNEQTKISHFNHLKPGLD